MLLKCSLIILLFFATMSKATTAVALTDENTYLKSITETQVFLSWLDKHKKSFAECTPQKLKEDLILCDGTKIKVKELQNIFKMKPEELVSFIKKQSIKLEIMCKESHKNNSNDTFKNWCSVGLNRQFFKEVSSLHGQYLPNENTIALNSDSNFGSLVHEYLHYLQYQNKNKVYGHIYKQERIKAQNQIVKSFDDLIANIQLLEKDKKISEAKSLIKHALTFSDLLMKFGYWQKLIDERNLFLLYINYSKELGVAEEDVALAIKNMGFLCKDKELTVVLNKQECP